jgi:hypothetical protein
VLRLPKVAKASIKSVVFTDIFINKQTNYTSLKGSFTLATLVVEIASDNASDSNT